MNDEKEIKRLRTTVESIRWIVESINMIPVVILIFFEMTAVWRVILSSCILLLYTIVLVCFCILKDYKGIFTRGVLYVLWFIALIANVFRI